MFAGWMIAGMVLGVIGAAIVWALLIALVVAWYEDRHHKHAR